MFCHSHIYDKIEYVAQPYFGEELTGQGVKYPDLAVLIVDDEAPIRTILKQHLQEYTTDILDVADGEACLKILDVKKINILFLDIRLPGINGLDILKKVNKEKPDINVVTVSSYGDKKTKLSALQMGAFDFLEKPFLRESILYIVDSIMDKNFSSDRPSSAETPQNQTMINTLIASNHQETTNIFTRFFVNMDSDIKYVSTLDAVKVEAGKSTIDILLISLDFPFDDMLKLVKELKSNEATEDCYILIISKESTSMKVNEAFSKGTDDYIIYPIKPIQLKSKLSFQIKKQIKFKKQLSDIAESFQQLKTKSNGVTQEIPQAVAAPVVDTTKVVALETELKKVSGEKISLLNEVKTLKEQQSNAPAAKEEKVEDKELEKLKESKKDIPADDLQAQLEDKDNQIDKLSELLNKRARMAQARAKNAKGTKDLERQQRESLMKLKADGKKEVLDEQKKSVGEAYEEINETFGDASQEIVSLCVSVENSNTNKDNMVDSSINKVKALIEELIKDVLKYKELYYEASNDQKNLEVAKLAEEERSKRIETIQDESKSELEETSQGLKVQLDEIKENVLTLQKKVESSVDDLATKRADVGKTEKEWLFLVQDSYKEKFFELMDSFKEAELKIDEGSVQVALLEKKLKQAEDMLTILRQK